MRIITITLSNPTVIKERNDTTVDLYLHMNRHDVRPGTFPPPK